MERPIEAYRGDEPYVFICYAHDDQAVVYPEITWLHEQGINVWYDEGISPGEEWSEELGQAIDGAERFLYFVSPRSVASRHCRNELNFAQNHNKAILSVYLEETELPSGVELVIGASQAIVKPDLAEMDYRTRLLRAVGRVKASPHPVPDDKAIGSAAAPQPTDGTPRPSLASWRVAAVVLVVAGAGAAFWFFEPSAPDVTPEERSDATRTFDRSIAVLPFSVVGTDAGTATYADAVREELGTAVAGYQELRLVSVAESVTPQDIDQASYVVGGNVQHLGDRMRLRASLTRTDDRHIVWAKTFEHPAADEMPDPAETAVTVGRFVRLQLVQDQQCETVRRRSRSAEAADAYCASLAEVYRSSQAGFADTQLALARALRAVALDPDIAEAHLLAGLNYCWLGEGGQLDWRDAVKHAREALGRFMVLAPADAQALALRGRIEQLELNYPAAIADLSASVMNDPLHPFAQLTWMRLGNIAMAQGRLGEALEHYRRALRIYDANAFIRMLYANALYSSGQYREALREAEASLRLIDTGHTLATLLDIKAGAQLALGERARADATLDEALTNVESRWQPGLVVALATLSRTEEALELLAAAGSGDRELPPEAMGAAYAALGDERAFDYLHEGIDRHLSGIVGGLRVGPVYLPLHQSPRWDEVMAHLEAEEAKGRSRSNESG